MALLKSGVVRFVSALDWLDTKISFTWWLLAILAGFITWEVIMRYFFKSPHNWSLELCILLYLWGSFLGCGTATKTRRHIAIDVVYTRTSGRLRWIFDVINAIATIIVSGFLAYYVLEYTLAIKGMSHTSDLASPYWIAVAAVFVGLVLCTVYSLRNVLALSLREQGLTPTDQA